MISPNINIIEMPPSEHQMEIAKLIDDVQFFIDTRLLRMYKNQNVTPNVLHYIKCDYNQIIRTVYTTDTNCTIGYDGKLNLTLQ